MDIVKHVKIFADGADKAAMLEMAAKAHVAGLTTNPTLMRKAGISDYRAFAKEVLSAIRDKPISFEVFSDDFAEMERIRQVDLDQPDLRRIVRRLRRNGQSDRERERSCACENLAHGCLLPSIWRPHRSRRPFA